MENNEKKSADKSEKKAKKKTKNQPTFNTRVYIEKIHQVDVMEIYGLSEISALEILAETGTDLSKWSTKDKFVGWLTYAQTTRFQVEN